MGVQVFFTSLHHVPNPMLDEFANFLNEEDKRRAMAFHQVIDKYRFLAGRQLLQGWLTENNLPQNVDGIRMDEYKRPFLEGVSFSISHSGNWVGLAVSPHIEKIGLDIEENKLLEVKDYMLPFVPAEQQYILEDNNIARFYELWTRKEAVLKAIGKGFLLEPTSANVLGNNITVEGTQLYTYTLAVLQGYTAHLATGLPVAQNAINIVVKG